MGSNVLSDVLTSNAYARATTKGQKAPVVQTFECFPPLGLELLRITSKDILSSMQSMRVDHDLRSLRHEHP